MPTNDNSNQVKISVPTEVEDGVYSNFAVITHSKRLMYALSDNVAKYEKVNGPINLHDHRQGGSFPNPQGEA